MLASLLTRGSCLLAVLYRINVSREVISYEPPDLGGVSFLGSGVTCRIAPFTHVIVEVVNEVMGLGWMTARPEGGSVTRFHDLGRHATIPRLTALRLWSGESRLVAAAQTCRAEV
jgi:hypothetical protein